MATNVREDDGDFDNRPSLSLQQMLRNATARLAGEKVSSQVRLGTLIFTYLSPAQLAHFSENLGDVKQALSTDSRKKNRTPEHVDALYPNIKVAEARAQIYDRLVITIVMEVSEQFTEVEIQRYLDQKSEIPALVAQWFAI